MASYQNDNDLWICILFRLEWLLNDLELYFSGKKSFPVELPKHAEIGSVTETPKQYVRSFSVHPMPLVDSFDDKQVLMRSCSCFLIKSNFLHLFSWIVHVYWF